MFIYLFILKWVKVVLDFPKKHPNVHTANKNGQAQESLRVFVIQILVNLAESLCWTERYKVSACRRGIR